MPDAFVVPHASATHAHPRTAKATRRKSRFGVVILEPAYRRSSSTNVTKRRGRKTRNTRTRKRRTVVTRKQKNFAGQKSGLATNGWGKHRWPRARPTIKTSELRPTVIFLKKIS